MDLCAAAIYRLTGESLRADRERDVGWWLDTRGKQHWRLVPMPPSSMAEGVPGPRDLGNGN